MKNITFKNWWLVIVLMAGCTSGVEDLKIGEPFSQKQAAIDEWTLVQVRHVDELSALKPYANLTSMFTQTEATLVLSEGTFEYTQPAGPAFLANTGTWAFDDEEYPAEVILNGTQSLKLGAPIRSANDTLILKLERKCPANGQDRTVSSYQFVFKRK